MPTSSTTQPSALSLVRCSSLCSVCSQMLSPRVYVCPPLAAAAGPHDAAAAAAAAADGLHVAAVRAAAGARSAGASFPAWPPCAAPSSSLVHGCCCVGAYCHYCRPGQSRLCPRPCCCCRRPFCCDLSSSTAVQQQESKGGGGGEETSCIIIMITRGLASDRVRV